MSEEFVISTNTNQSSHGFRTEKPTLFSYKKRKYQWPGDMYYSHGSKHSKGVLMLIRETLQFELKSVKKDNQGRFVIVEALVQECPVLLINIYAPYKTNEATDFYENLRSTLLESDYDQDYKIVMGGDFNAPLNPQLDSYGSKTEKKRGSYKNSGVNIRLKPRRYMEDTKTR